MQDKTGVTPISAREKLVIILTLFLIKMLHPWEFDHQFTRFWDEVKSNIS